MTKFFSQSVSVKFPPNIVNIHVKHPPEASVQIHQVSRIDGPTGQKVKEAQPGQSQISYQGLPVQKTQTIHSTYSSHQQIIPHVYPVAAKTQLGRCFQETIGSQVSNVAPPILVMSSRYSGILKGKPDFSVNKMIYCRRGWQTDP